MKCRRCHGSGVDPEGSWTDEEKDKVVRGVLEFDVSQKESYVIDQIKELFDDEEISVKRQKVLLAELGAEFPTVRRKVTRMDVHLSLDSRGKVTSISKTPPGAKP